MYYYDYNTPTLLSEGKTPMYDYKIEKQVKFNRKEHEKRKW